MASSPPSRRKSRSGEPFVWLTGMGLVVGIAMITSLLVVIIWKGVRAFWPARIARITLTEEAAKQFGYETIVGAVIEKRAKPGAPLAVDGTRPTEIKLQVGNKDVTGAPFVYVDLAAIRSVEFPLDVVRLERMEYGPAIGELQTLQLAGQAPIDLRKADSREALMELLESVNARRDEINEIEKDEIGVINRQMTELRRDQRRIAVDAEGGTPDAAALAAIDERMQQLEADYGRLAARARELREAQKQDSLTYLVNAGPGGVAERAIHGGDLVYAYAPNELDFLGQLGVTGHNFWEFIAEDPREANTEGGIFPALFGTFAMTVILSVIVTPFGVIAAIYLREYAKEGPVVRAVRIAINNLAGVPSIVFGVFGLGFFVYVVGGSIDSLFFRHHESAVFGTGGILWASLTLALMTVPVVIVATEEALAAVSRGVREGSLACGASKWQTIQRVVLPAAAPGIITGMILAMARGAGEVAPLMITGVVKLAPTLPLDLEFPFLHLDRKFMHLGFHIYDLGFQSPDSDAAKPMVFATTLLLIALVVTMNLAAIVIRERLRRKYATGAF